MKMKKIGFFLTAVVLIGTVTIAAAADCDIAKEPEQICLYGEYVFQKGSIGEGIISLSYVVPGKMVKEKGLQGIWKEVIEKILKPVSREGPARRDVRILG